MVTGDLRSILDEPIDELSPMLRLLFALFARDLKMITFFPSLAPFLIAFLLFVLKTIHCRILGIRPMRKRVKERFFIFNSYKVFC